MKGRASLYGSTAQPELRRRRPDPASGAAASSACLAAAGWPRVPLPRPEPDADDLAGADAAAFLAVVRLVGRSGVAWPALAARFEGAAAGAFDGASAALA